MKPFPHRLLASLATFQVCALSLFFSLLANLFCHISRIYTALSNTMSVAIDGTPARAFNTHLRKQDKEMENLNTKCFDLKLKVYHLECQLRNKNENLRNSTSSQAAEDYYFTPASEKDPDLSDFVGENEIIDELKKQLDLERRANEELENSLNQIEKELQDREEDAQHMRVELEEKFEREASLKDDEIKDLIIQRDDALSHSKKLQESLNHTIEHTKRSLKNDTAAAAKTIGMKLQYEALIEAVDAGEARSTQLANRLATATIQRKKAEAVAEDRKKVAMEERTVRIAMETQVTELVSENQKSSLIIKTLKQERDAATASVKAEMVRAKIWEETSEMLENKDALLNGDSPVLDKMVEVLQKQKDSYNAATEYQPNWRKTVENDMDTCMKLLFHLHREVDVKRHAIFGMASAFTGLHPTKPPGETV